MTNYILSRESFPEPSPPARSAPPDHFAGRHHFLTQLGNVARYNAYKYLLRASSITLRIHHFRINVDLHDPGISKSLLLHDDWRQDQHYMLKSVIRSGQTILDLGSNIGYCVLRELQLLGSTGRVVAVEPSPCNYYHLLKNLALNNVEEQVVTVNAAVTDKTGPINLYLSQLSNVHSLSPNHIPQPTHQSIKVNATTLAELYRKHGPFNIIRMDIEGYEHTVLSALLELIPLPRLPLILFETHPDTYHDDRLNPLFTQMFKLGYQAQYLSSSNLSALRAEGLSPITHLSTDGTIRHIVKQINLPSLLKLYRQSQAILLAPI